MTTATEGSIYVITCAPTGKKYVGQTIVPIKTRFYQHMRVAGYANSCLKLGHAVKKYGRGAFSIEEIERAPLAQLDERETHWIAALKTVETGFNVKRGGKGASALPEVRQRQSDAHMGHKQSDETRLKISTTMKGRKLSEETKRRMSRKISATNLSTGESFVFDTPKDCAAFTGLVYHTVLTNATRQLRSCNKLWRLRFV